MRNKAKPQLTWIIIRNTQAWSTVFSVAIASQGLVASGAYSHQSPGLRPLHPLAQVPHTQIKTAQNIRRSALIIGNGDYQQTGKLQNPSNDAQDIATALKALGFEVQLLINANLRQMESALSLFSQQLRQGGVGVFYYAGHGIQVDGENYLVPIDAKLDSDLDVRYEALPAGKVLNAMESAENNANILILDACRNNPFKKKWAARSRDIAVEGLAPLQAVKGSYIAYATAPGKVAFDGQGRNGTFTSRLLQHIQTPNLSVENLFKRVRQEVANETRDRQIPWDSSSLVGEFSFNPQQSKTLAQPSSTPVTTPSHSTLIPDSSTTPTTSTSQTAFASIPRLVQAVSTNNTAKALSATYYFTISVPETAGSGLQTVSLQLTEGADQDLEFDLKRSYAFEGDSYRKQRDRLPFQAATFDPKTKTVSLTFATPVNPGKVITIGLHPYRNPTIAGVYLFDIAVYPTGNQAKPQSIGYARLTFYMGGF